MDPNLDGGRCGDSGKGRYGKSLGETEVDPGGAAYWHIWMSHLRDRTSSCERGWANGVCFVGEGLVLEAVAGDRFCRRTIVWMGWGHGPLGQCDDRVRP